MNKKTVVVLVSAFALLMALVLQMHRTAMAAGAPQRRDHPQMDAAMHNLQEARRHLQNAEPIYAGHRDKALHHVDEAIHEMEIAFRENP